MGFCMPRLLSSNSNSIPLLRHAGPCVRSSESQIHSNSFLSDGNKVLQPPRAGTHSLPKLQRSQVFYKLHPSCRPDVLFLCTMCTHFECFLVLGHVSAQFCIGMEIGMGMRTSVETGGEDKAGDEDGDGVEHGHMGSGKGLGLIFGISIASGAPTIPLGPGPVQRSYAAARANRKSNFTNARGGQ